MNPKMLTRAIAPLILSGIALALSACASAPPHELSILEAINAQASSQRFNMGPQSCAAIDTASVCVKSTRLDKGKDCACTDRHSITDGTFFRF
jgi:hypothetical protein